MFSLFISYIPYNPLYLITIPCIPEEAGINKTLSSFPDVFSSVDKYPKPSYGNSILFVSSLFPLCGKINSPSFLYNPARHLYHK